MKPTIERLQTQLAGLQAQLAYAQQERDAAVKASAAARERETATADILRIINESPVDLERIMPEIVGAIERLCEADHGVIGFEVKGSAAQPTFHNWDRIRGLRVFEQGVSRFVLSAADEIRGFIHVVGRVEDWEAEYPGLVGITRADGLTELALLSVPLVSGKTRIGYMLARRNTARAFGAHHITLLQHLAGQAVVAVENARAFNELEARNREVARALEQQTATAEILDVISRSPSNLQTALDAVVLNATRLLESNGAVVIRFMPDGTAGWVAVANGSEIAPGPRLATPAPTPADAGSEAMAILLGGRTVMRHGGPDSIAADAPNLAAAWRARGVNASIVTPLQTTRGRFGALVVTRASPEPYTDAQIRLLETFASQAVIAIENAGLFSELQTRNQEVTAALNEQTAMAEVLGIIAASPESLEKPLQAIVESAARLCEGTVANLWLLDGTDAYIAAQHKPANLAAASDVPVGRRVPIGAVALFSALRDGRSRRVDSWNDIDAKDYPRDPSQRVPAHVDRSAVYVPLHVRDEYIGMIAIFRETVRPFSDHNVELVSTFAQQAVIAIENARLLRELRESNREISENLDVQRVMGNVLSIVASAPTDLQATLPQIALAAQQLCDALTSTVHWIDGDRLHAFDGGASNVASRPFDPEWARTSMMGAAALGNRVIELAGSIDELAQRYPYTASIWARGPYRTDDVSGLAIPMQGQGEAFGAISVWRRNRTSFTERQRAVLSTLANQAVIAIENARLFNQLQTKTQELEIASRHKSEFLANMSHELRTPLNAIIGYSELLQEECEDLGQDDFLPDLGKIHTAGKHLLQLISGILDLSKVEAGRMTMYLEDFDVATLVSEAESIVRPVVEKNRNAFVIDCPADIGVMHADLVKVRQVLFNLLSNAAKFTEGGTITLTVRRHAEPATYTFAIRDTGIGITDAQLARLFEAFSQAEAHTSRKYGGTGLGLALSREFCRMMGGDIAVDSVAGAGSTFTVTLPTLVADSEAASNSDPTKAQGS